MTKRFLDCFLVARDAEMGGNQCIVVHYRDVIRNSEHESSQGEVPDADDNADRTSSVHHSYWPRRPDPFSSHVQQGKDQEIALSF